MLLAHFVGNACPRQSDELGERRIRPARATRRRGNEAGDGCVAVTVKRAKITFQSEQFCTATMVNKSYHSTIIGRPEGNNVQKITLIAHNNAAFTWRIATIGSVK
jgi:hypothetical protein